MGEDEAIPAVLRPPRVDVSVVIPARNAAGTIAEQLDALLAQQTDARWELIVSDNGSTDSTRALVERYVSRDSRVRLVDASACRGVAHARNTGIDAARGDEIMMCDADDVVAPGWLHSMHLALRDHDLVTGRLEIDRLNAPWLAASRGRRLSQAAGDFLGQVTFANSGNLGFRRSAVEPHGYFDETLAAGEDIELSFRLWKAGVPVHYADDAVVSVRYRPTARAMWRQSRAHAAVKPVLVRRLREAGVDVSMKGELRAWLWLVRNVGQLRTRAGRARWLWVAGSRVGVVEGLVRGARPRGSARA